MHKKALTVAIAGVLAAPMAAQAAIDFTISGQVNRALFITDSDAGTNAAVANNGGSSTRVRANGSSELMEGRTVGIQFEYEEKAGGLSLRHANIQYSGDFGRITIGQGSEAGDGSAYSDTTGVKGIGHGAGNGAGFSLGDFFGSLDAGGRKDMIRYDTPDIGPASVAVSVANDDSISARLKLSSDMGGTTIGAQVATLRTDGYKEGVSAESTSASFGLTMESGLTVSGAWAKGNGHGGAAATAAVTGYGCFDDTSGKPTDGVVNSETCPTGSSIGFGTTAAAKDEMMATDPSYYQVEIGYIAGDTGFAVSWYNSEDFMMEGTDGTAIGVGVRHTLAAVGAEIYAAAQNYDVEYKGVSSDETVIAIGTLVKF